MATQELEWIDCGYANGWKERPERVKMADADPEATWRRKNIGRCLNEYICDKYKVKYTVDSSD